MVQQLVDHRLHHQPDPDPPPGAAGDGLPLPAAGEVEVEDGLPRLIGEDGAGAVGLVDRLEGELHRAYLLRPPVLGAYDEAAAGVHSPHHGDRGPPDTLLPAELLYLPVEYLSVVESEDKGPPPPGAAPLHASDLPLSLLLLTVVDVLRQDADPGRGSMFGMDGRGGGI